jgi:hypothetical protein
VWTSSWDSGVSSDFPAPAICQVLCTSLLWISASKAPRSSSVLSHRMSKLSKMLTTCTKHSVVGMSEPNRHGDVNKIFKVCSVLEHFAIIIGNLYSLQQTSGGLLCAFIAGSFFSHHGSVFPRALSSYFSSHHAPTHLRLSSLHNAIHALVPLTTSPTRSSFPSSDLFEFQLVPLIQHIHRNPCSKRDCDSSYN